MTIKVDLEITNTYSDSHKEFFSYKNGNMYLMVSSMEEYKDALEHRLEYFDSFAEYGFNESPKEEVEKLRKELENADFVITEVRVDELNDDAIEIVNTNIDTIEKINILELNVSDLIKFCNIIPLDNNKKLVTMFNDGDYATIDEVHDLLEYLNSIKEYIERFNFSPLELCIFVYDLLREREYKYSEQDLELEELGSKIIDILADDFEEQIEKLSYSRSLFKIYKSDAIVCAGFAKMYSAILSMFNIKTEEISYNSIDKEDENSAGHASNIVYLDDDKYNEHVIMEVDPTWGRHYKENDEYDYEASLYNYSAFGLTIKEAMHNKSKSGMESGIINASIIGKITQEIDRLQRLKQIKVPNVILTGVCMTLYKNITTLSKFTDNKEFIKAYNIMTPAFDVILKHRNDVENQDKVNEAVDKFFEGINHIDNFFRYTLTPISLAQALERVKKVEHSIDHHKYPYDINKIIKIIDKKYKGDPYLKKIMMPFVFEHVILAEENDLDASRMELISALHKIAGDGIDQNPMMKKGK